MKKSYLVTGIAYVCIGAALLCAVLATETRLESLLWGFTGATLISGAATIIRYFYWTQPQNQARYEQRLENERIELHDELKTMLRDRSGRYAYLAGLLVICISIVVFSILGTLEIISESKLIVLYLAGYLLFQLVIGSVLFHRLMKKY